MKSLQHTCESLLDADFDIDMITLEEIIKTAYTQKFTGSSWREFAEKIANSYEPTNSSDCAQDYFGTIEVLEIGNTREIHIRFDPGHSRGFGSTRNAIKISYKSIETESDGCHWLMKPAYQIEDTSDNRKLLKRIYTNKRV